LITTYWQVDVEVFDKYGIKKLRPLDKCIDYLLRNFPQRFPDKQTATTRAKQSINSFKTGCQQIKQKGIPLKYFANPIFISPIHYQQDKVIPAKEILDGANFARKHWLIDQFIELTHLCWKYEVFEATFNFAENHGIDSTGNLVCIDFGELEITEEQRIKNKKFKKSKMEICSYNASGYQR